MKLKPWICAAFGAALTCAGTAHAQRAGDNAVTSAQDAFGTTVGTETIGLYSTRDARGFSPTFAGNIRLEGLYFDRQGNQGNYDRIFSGSAVHVGLSAQSYPFPAPTGIANFRLRIPGDKRIASVVATVGPYDQYALEVDTQTPIIGGKLSIGLGGGYQRTAYEWGSHSFQWTGGALARWRPTSNIEIVPFFNHSSVNDWEVRPFTFSNGAFTPPKFNRLTYFGQPYNDWEENDTNFGLISRFAWNTWTLRVGLFRSLSIKPEDALIFYMNGDRTGLADVSFLSNPRQRAGSYSGEVRLSKVFTEGDRRHTIHLSGRGRDTRRMFGGGDLESVGKYRMGEVVNIPRPNFVYTASNRDHVSQITGGIAYEGLWNDVGEFSAGLQKTSYQQTLEKPNIPIADTKSSPWLYNATLAIYATERLAFYGGYTKGLEESGTAPNNAANRDTVLPASITEQFDAGVRYAFTPSLKLVAGIFEVKKPFFDREPITNIFTQVGGLRHRGIEISLSGQAAEGLTIVGGAVILQARASGILVDQGLIGRIPGGRPSLITRINAQYAPLAWHGISIDGQIEYTQPGYSDGRDILKLTPFTQINLGARYRFEILGSPATLRVQVLNVTNTWGWTSGGQALAFFQHSPPRRVIASLTADF